MTNERRQALIKAHRDLRKEAFIAVSPKVAEFFQDAKTALVGTKHASESAHFDPLLRRHLVEP